MGCWAMPRLGVVTCRMRRKKKIVFKKQICERSPVVVAVTSSSVSLAATGLDIHRQLSKEGSNSNRNATRREVPPLCSIFQAQDLLPWRIVRIGQNVLGDPKVSTSEGDYWFKFAPIVC